MKVGSLDLLNCSLITLGEFIRLICRYSLSEPCGALSCLIRWEVLKFLEQTLLCFLAISFSRTKLVDWLVTRYIGMGFSSLFILFELGIVC